MSKLPKLNSNSPRLVPGYLAALASGDEGEPADGGEATARKILFSFAHVVMLLIGFRGCLSTCLNAMLLKVVPREDGLRMAISEVFQLDEARGRPLGRGGGEGHLAAEVAAVWVERHQPKDDRCKFLSNHFFFSGSPFYIVPCDTECEKNRETFIYDDISVILTISRKGRCRWS